MKAKISRTKSGQQLCSTNVNFNQYHVGKKLNKTLMEHNSCPDLVQLILISTSDMYKKGPKNDLFFNCQTKSKQLSKKELLNVAPALLWLQKQITKYKQRIDQLGLSLEMQKVYLVFVSLLNRTKTRKKTKWWRW